MFAVGVESRSQESYLARFGVRDRNMMVVRSSVPHDSWETKAHTAYPSHLSLNVLLEILGHGDYHLSR